MQNISPFPFGNDDTDDQSYSHHIPIRLIRILKGFRTYGRRQVVEGRDEWEAGRLGGGRGQVAEDHLINRVSDSAHFCPWDESSCGRQRSA